MSKHAKLLMTHTRRTFHSQRHDTVRNMSLWGPWRRSENHNEFWIWESVFLSIVEVSFAVLEFLQKLEHLKWRRDTPSNTRACTHPSHQAVFPLRHTVHIKQQAHDSFVNVAAHSSSSLFILSTITLLCWNTLTEQRSQRYVLQCSGFFSIFFFLFWHHHVDMTGPNMLELGAKCYLQRRNDSLLSLSRCRRCVSVCGF